MVANWINYTTVGASLEREVNTSSWDTVHQHAHLLEQDDMRQAQERCYGVHDMQPPGKTHPLSGGGDRYHNPSVLPKFSYTIAAEDSIFYDGLP